MTRLDALHDESPGFTKEKVTLLVENIDVGVIRYSGSTQKSWPEHKPAAELANYISIGRNYTFR
jgi:hypothetical protein